MKNLVKEMNQIIERVDALKEAKEIKGLDAAAKTIVVTREERSTREEKGINIDLQLLAAKEVNFDKVAEEFKGIRANKAASSKCSARNIERIQRKVMKRLYRDAKGNKSFYVIRRFVIDKDGVAVENYQTVVMSPTVMAFGSINTETRTLSVMVEDAVGNFKERKLQVGPGKDYKLIDDVILVNFRNTEGYYDDYRINGLQVGGDINSPKFYPASSSASMGKKSNVYFTLHDPDTQYEVIDRLTGGMLQKKIDELKCNKEIATFDDIAGVASRISLCATTPSLWGRMGNTNSVFYFKGSVDSEDEKSTIADVDNHFRDGYGIIRDTFGALMVEEFAEEEVSEAMARRMSYQLRIRGVAGKGHFRAYDSKQMLKEVEMLLKIDPSRCFMWIEGSRVDLSNIAAKLNNAKNKTEYKKALKELEVLVDNIDIISDKDVFKWGQPDMSVLDEGKALAVGIVNMSNRTRGHMGNQIAFKLKDYPEKAAKMFAALTNRQLAAADPIKEDASGNLSAGKLSFHSEELKLDGFTYQNVMKSNPEKAATDLLLNSYKIKSIDTALLNKVANLKLEINSNYLRMVPEDHLLNNGKEVLGARMVDYTMPDGSVQKVKCIEVYSSSFNTEYKELKKQLADIDTMTDEEKSTALESARVSVIIKSPSQGSKEFEVCYNITEEEVMKLNATWEYKQFLLETPDNCIVLAQDNTLKHQLAGSDFDGDDLTQIFPELTITENGKVVTGLMLDGKVVEDYVSILVYARVVRDNNIGVAALIKYHDNKPVAERVKEEESKKMLDSLDYSALF